MKVFSILSEKKSLVAESLWGGALVFFWLLLLKPLFVSPVTFWHDNLYWNLPNFHFFAERLLLGEPPWWNPFSHSGEPFYPMLLQIRLLEPLTLLYLGIAQFFTRDLVHLYHSHRLFLTLFLVVTAYGFFRRYTQSLFTRLLLQPVLLLSSLSLVSFRADAALNHLLWIPLLAYFASRLWVEGSQSLRDRLGLVLCLGVNFQSYFFVLPTMFVLLFFFGSFLFHRKTWKQSFSFSPKTSVLCFFLLLGFSLPNLSALQESSRFLFTSRLLPKNYEKFPSAWQAPAYQGGEYDETNSIGFSAEAIKYGGAVATPWEYLQTLVPEGNGWIFGRISQLGRNFGSPSEIFLFFGIFPWFLILWGMYCVSSKEHKLWLFLLLTSTWLALGPDGGLHRFLFPLLPPLWLLRHTQFFSLLTTFCAFYFLIQGSNALFNRTKGRGRLAVFLFCFTVLLHISFVAWYFPDKTYLALKLCCFLLPPILLTWTLQKLSTRLTKFLVIAFVTADLLFHFRSMATLYASAPLPHSTLNASRVPTKTNFVSERKLAPYFPPIRLWGSQRPRYLGNIERVGYGFSRVLRPESAEIDLAFHGQVPWWDALYVPRAYFSRLKQEQDPKRLQSLLGLSQNRLTFESGRQNFALLPQSYSPTELSVTFEAPVDGKLRWLDGWDPHWRASLDGKSLEIAKFQEIFKEVSVPKGTHSLKFTYVPTLWIFSLVGFYLVFALGWLTVLGCPREHAVLKKSDSFL